MLVNKIIILNLKKDHKVLEVIKKIFQKDLVVKEMFLILENNHNTLKIIKLIVIEIFHQLKKNQIRKYSNFKVKKKLMLKIVLIINLNIKFHLKKKDHLLKKIQM